VTGEPGEISGCISIVWIVCFTVGTDQIFAPSMLSTFFKTPRSSARTSSPLCHIMAVRISILDFANSRASRSVMCVIYTA
jgi:hypothetical protein